MWFLCWGERPELRQGDPMSLYLFVLAMEVFSGLMNQVSTNALKRPPKRFILMLGKHRPSSTCIIILKKSMCIICQIYVTYTKNWSLHYVWCENIIIITSMLFFTLTIGLFSHIFSTLGGALIIFFIFFFISLNFLRKTL